jgi:hypothetical protein
MRNHLGSQVVPTRNGSLRIKMNTGIRVSRGDTYRTEDNAFLHPHRKTSARDPDTAVPSDYDETSQCEKAMTFFYRRESEEQ